MPTDAFIAYKNKLFYIREDFIEVLSDYICRVIENKGLANYSDKLKAFYTHCNFAREGASTNMMNIRWERYMDNEADREALKEVLKQTQQLLQEKGELISIEELNAFEKRKIDEYFVDLWFAPVETRYLVDALDLMVQMLNETLQQSNFIF